MAAKKYRVGVIGRTGKGNYGHGLDRVWSAIPQAEVIAVADEHAGGRAKAAKSPTKGAKSPTKSHSERSSVVFPFLVDDDDDSSV